MTDYISRQALKNALTDWQMEYAEKSKDTERFETLGQVIDFVEQMPTIEPKPSRDWNGWENGCGRTYDVQPKKGKWITEYDSWGGLFKTVRAHKCSICNHYLDFDGVNAGRGDANYCPNCGAKMERSEE